MHSSILLFVVFMGVLRWGWVRGIPATPQSPSVTALLKGSLRLSKKCIVGASSARP